MAKVAITESYLTDIADAIRSKTGSIETYKPSEMASAISEISGGETILKPYVLRPDATLASTYGYDKYLEKDCKITIPSYSTTASTVLPTEDISPTIQLDFTNYDYYIVERMLTIPDYNTGTKAKGRVEYHLSSYLYELEYTKANTYPAIIDPEKTYATAQATAVRSGYYRLVYYSSGTAIAAYSTATYGYSAAAVTPAVTTAGVLTLKTPNYVTRGHTTYFVNTFMNAVTDVRLQFIAEVWRAPKNNLNIDGFGNSQNILHILDCIKSNNHKLT